MAAPLPLQRPRFVLFTALALWFLVLSLQAKREGTGSSRLEEWTLALVRPVVAGSGQLVDALARAGTGLVDLRRAAIENARFREEIRAKDLELARLRGIETEVGRLQELLGYRSSAVPEGRLARVAYTDTRGWFKSVLLDRGTEAGLAAGSPVLDARGVIGRVVVATEGFSKVQLLIDSNASVGCLVERTRQQGVARGDGGLGLDLRYLPRTSDVKVGDRVLTAGNDGIYPPGLLVGMVVHSVEGDGTFREIRLRPGVDFLSLESVLALPARRIPEELRQWKP